MDEKKDEKQKIRKCAQSQATLPDVRISSSLEGLCE